MLGELRRNPPKEFRRPTCPNCQKGTPLEGGRRSSGVQPVEGKLCV